MVNMHQISSSKNPGGEKIDDKHITLCLTLPHQKLHMRNHKWKTHIKKRVQCILCHNIIHQKTSKGEMDYMT